MGDGVVWGGGHGQPWRRGLAGTGGREDERMVDALAVAAEEGRGHAAKRPGEALAASDPGVSEWGNPPRACLGTSFRAGGHRGN